MAAECGTGLGAESVEEPEKLAMGMGRRCENRGKDPVRREPWPLVLFTGGSSGGAEVIELAMDMFSQGPWRDGHRREL